MCLMRHPHYSFYRTSLAERRIGCDRDLLLSAALWYCTVGNHSFNWIFTTECIACKCFQAKAKYITLECAMDHTGHWDYHFLRLVRLYYILSLSYLTSDFCNRI